MLATRNVSNDQYVKELELQTSSCCWWAIHVPTPQHQQRRKIVYHLKVSFQVTGLPAINGCLIVECSSNPLNKFFITSSASGYTRDRAGFPNPALTGRGFEIRINVGKVLQRFAPLAQECPLPYALAFLWPYGPESECKQVAKPGLVSLTSCGHRHAMHNAKLHACASVLNLGMLAAGGIPNFYGGFDCHIREHSNNPGYQISTRRITNARPPCAG